ncbi:Bug family tripartite tricarboxylate transporter substrate binding protein [Ancylobacter defluvii]|uniref:Tricarboxylate transporter n=1 Tax=Ancylobacter defluvii TaxID=1282440 RepID=A0A9W6K1P1_9HYPH|nr:tripartite tricarboxylate transporter substrate-binding protein [Ancylobacter defluvii]MBS7586576.1 tripartite tricarboxylate transporter substrate binding protein [Ancylobacter defluvii]GLK85864.1 tricarboxylate transporter [Ancylobacter defluvii]
MPKHALTALALCLGLAVPSVALAEWKPNRPVEFVAAAGPGGGTDTFARVVQSALSKNELLTTPIIVSNKAGGSGAETFIYAKSNKGDPYKLYFGTQDAYVLPLANKLSYSLKDLTPIAAMVFDPFMLWVNPKTSGIEDVKGFIAKAKEAPGQLKLGGAKAKEADETLMTLIEHATGVDLTYIPYKSGSEAAIQVAGGHITANVNNPSESVEQWKAGVQKPLCVFENERLADTTVIADGLSWHDIPTCKEAGIAVDSFAQPRTIWAAADLPPEALAYYTDLFTKAAAAPEFKAYQQRGAQIPRLLTGDAFKDFIKKHEASYAEIYKRNGWLRAEQ